MKRLLKLTGKKEGKNFKKLEGKENHKIKKIDNDNEA